MFIKSIANGFISISEENSEMSGIISGNLSLMGNVNLPYATNLNGFHLVNDSISVNSSLALKADNLSVNSALALKADTTYVNSSLLLKADQTYTDSALILKEDIAVERVAEVLPKRFLEIGRGSASQSRHFLDEGPQKVGLLPLDDSVNFRDLTAELEP